RSCAARRCGCGPGATWRRWRGPTARCSSTPAAPEGAHRGPSTCRRRRPLRGRGGGRRAASNGNRAGAARWGPPARVGRRGISRDLTRAKVAKCVDEVGIGFLYAPLLHTAMKHVMPARREMGIRTVFNILGPLTNPAGANAQVIGVYARHLVEPLARVLAELGTIRAFVVHGADGLDEISTTGESWVAEVREGVVRTSTVRPEDFGVQRVAIGELLGGDREQNAEIIRRVL